ncbi:LysR substrate-binding domain-containing protein [Kibdelosporangium aridum]|uniref:LysR substrate-binding domain-containing protein n=1 Tax=Kibdelosporangium aridum TaxID=2030 RepID=UPI00068F4FB7
MKQQRLLDGSLKLRHLVLLSAIARRGSVLHAAHELRVSQPVVTRGLRELESLLGVDLFDRGPRGMTLTTYGEAFLSHTEVALTQIQQAGRQLALIESGQTGSVTIGTFLAGSNLLLPQAITSLKAAHPKITVIVREGMPAVLIEDLLSGEIDMTVGRLTPTDLADRVAQIRMYAEPVRLVVRAGHPALDRPSVSLSDLLGYPWILPGEATSLRREIEEVFLQSGLPLPVDRVESGSILTLRALLLSSDSIAVLPMLIPEDDDHLETLPTPLPSVSRKVGVTLAAGMPHSPSAALMLEHLHATASRIRTHLAGHPGDKFNDVAHELLECVRNH